MAMMEKRLSEVLRSNLKVCWKWLLMRGNLKTTRHLRGKSIALLTNLDFVPSLGGGASSSAVHTAVPPVFDGIVAPSTQAASDFSPSFAHLGDHLLDENALLWSDGFMVQVGLQVLMEPLPALLGRPGLDCLRDADPIVSAMKVDQ